MTEQDVERLQAENAKLRKALELIRDYQLEELEPSRLDVPEEIDGWAYEIQDFASQAHDVARAALEGQR